MNRKEKLRAKLAFKYEDVKSFFEKEGCRLLSTEYINARTKLEYICSCGNRAKIVFESFKVGNRCKKCGTQKTIEKLKKKNQQILENIACKNNVKILQILKRKISFICGCGKEDLKDKQAFKKNPVCFDCSVKNRSGPNHYEWITNRDLKNNKDIFRQKCYKMIKYILKKFNEEKRCKTYDMLGYDAKELMKYITNHENFKKVKNKKWSIDHIFPIQAFIDYNIFDIKLINCLENLRPILQIENSSKGDKYDKLEFFKWLKSKGIEIE